MKMRKNSANPCKTALVFLPAFFIVIIDQLTKRFFESGFLGVKTTHNTGAAFSILQNSNLLLLFFAIMVLGGLLYFYDMFPKSAFFYVMIGLVIGGIVGNCIDRIILGYVIDFIDLVYWPVFNIADSAVVVGAFGSVLEYIKRC